MEPDLRAPFPWFGGKRRVAAQVWATLGDVDNYVEPFAGSLAVLLGRPLWHSGRTETVNDADAYLCNFWRALAADPEGVARETDWPVNETDLFARHLWLVNSGRERIAQLEQDPEFYDVRVAGWWVWGLCSWIGSGWCSGKGPWTLEGDAGRGVNRQLPHLGDAGRGVNRKPCDLIEYFAGLAERLRRVRVCCGDWSRVVTDGALAYGNTVGVFLDPPYDLSLRCDGCYNHDNEGLSHAVREWALAHGDNPRYRIVLAGYEAEHEAHLPPTWRRYAYKANAAYQTANANGRNQANRTQERLWFSPHCEGHTRLPPQPEQTTAWSESDE